MPDRMKEESLQSGILTTTTDEAPPSKGKRIVKGLAWFAVFLFFLILFTFTKLPEERVRELVLSQANAALGPMGMTVSAQEGSFSFLLGPSYSLKEVTLSMAASPETVVLDKVEIAPSIGALFAGRLGAKVLIRQSDGSLELQLSRNFAGTDTKTRFESHDLNVGKLAILAASPVSMKASAILNGTGELQGDINTPNTLNGQVDLKITRFNVQSARLMIEPSMNYGIDLPKFNISEGDIAFAIDSGKLKIQTLKLGKTAADDIRAKVSGDISLARFLGASQLNLRASLSFSPELMKSMSLFDTLYASAKQPDGSYQLQIVGPMGGPNIQAAGAPSAAPTAPAPPAGAVPPPIPGPGNAPPPEKPAPAPAK